MAWFNYLKNKGHFDPTNNPAPKEVEGGYNVPFWPVLEYLEKISLSIKNGENTELTSDIIQVIRDVSENPVDNYRTWYMLIKILSNVPNENIPLDILDYIPVWTSGQFDTMLQTQEICKSLLPKFLSSTASDTDTEKAEKILSHLFTLKENPRVTQGNGYSTSQYSCPFYLYFLSLDLMEGQLLNTIAKKCSIVPLINLMDNLDLLLRDAPVSAEAEADSITYIFEVFRKCDDLTLKVQRKEAAFQQEIIFDPIKGYRTLPKGFFEKFLHSVFEQIKIPGSIFDMVNNRLSYNLDNDMVSAFGYNAIKNLQDEQDGGHNEIINCFSFILREWLTALAAIQESNKIKEIADFVFKSNSFQLPFFKRMFFYIIPKNWVLLKDWFWFIAEQQPAIFSDEIYRHELHYLLSHIPVPLDSNEVAILNSVFENGPIHREFYTPEPEYWKHRWLDALKGQEAFSNAYMDLHKKLGIKANYSEEGKINIRVGNISPLTKDEILEMDNQQLVGIIYDFRNKDDWEDPTMEGLADELCAATEEEPLKFSSLLPELKKASYIYIYYILYGFQKAVKNKKHIDWQTIIEFCGSYIQSEEFLNGQLVGQSGLGVNQDWIYGNIASLISDGTHDNEVSFGVTLLPQVKLLLKDLHSEVRPDTKRYEGNIILDDYVTTAINTTSGRILQAMIHYALKYTRNILNEGIPRWENDMKIVYETSIRDMDPAAFAFLSMYLPQFLYLDQEWLETQLTSVKDAESHCRSAFVDGLAFIKPLSRKYYEMTFDLYNEYATVQNLSNRYKKGIINHLIAYYLWDYETIPQVPLIIKILLEQPDANVLSNILGTLSRLSGEETLKPLFEKKIFPLWGLVNHEMRRFTEKNEINLLMNIIYMNDFIEVLTVDNIGLITQNQNLLSSQQNLLPYIDDILRWTKNSSPELIALLIKDIRFDAYFDQKKVKDIIEFLFENGHRDIALEALNTITIRGYDFLRDTYNKYRLIN